MVKSRRRRALPSSAFAYPKTRRYPIDTPARARAALALAARSSTAGSYANVARAVRKRYGDAIKTTSPSTGVVYRPGLAKGAKR